MTRREKNYLVHLPHLLPGWSLRILLILVAGAMIVVTPTSLAWSIILALVAITVAFVWSARLAWVLLLLLALTTLAAGSVFSVAVLVNIAGLHLLYFLGAWSAVVPVRGRVELAALLPTMKRWVIIQVPVQLGTLGLFWLHGSSTWMGFALVAGASIAALALLVIGVVWRRNRPLPQNGAPGGSEMDRTDIR